MIARCGSLQYTITVQTEGADPFDLERTRDSVAALWRWTTLTTAEEERIRALREVDGTGYRVTVPPGWRGLKADALPDLAALDADTFWSGYTDRDGSTHVIVSHRPAPYEDLKRAVNLMEPEQREYFEP